MTEINNDQVQSEYGLELKNLYHLAVKKKDTDTALALLERWHDGCVDWLTHKENEARKAISKNLHYRQHVNHCPFRKISENITICELNKMDCPKSSPAPEECPLRGGLGLETDGTEIRPVWSAGGWLSEFPREK